MVEEIHVALHHSIRTAFACQVRIGHRLQDFLFLPYKAMADPAVRTMYSKYVSAYTVHEETKTDGVG